MGRLKRPLAAVIAVVAAATLWACQPTVRIEAPDKPIEINLNVRIEQEIRVRIERDLQEVFDENPDIF